ncbi:MAG: NrdH-redoxin [Candidatus Buchananbacteria bacterium]|nr:NrdH-redoxin [Candidatus Buchananbacteria bacterium]
MAEQKKVIIYTTPTCPYCKQTKEYLKENEIEYQEMDVANDSAKAQEMIDKSGQMGVPVIDIEGEMIVGFDKEKIDKALDLK